MVSRQSHKLKIVGSIPTVRNQSFSGCGVIGSRTRFRFWRRKAWEFESPHPHHIFVKQPEERWMSGLNQQSTKLSVSQGARGFESHPFRHTYEKVHL